MSTTLTNGLKLPDKGSVDWYADMQSNYTILDGAVGTIADHTTAIAGKAPAVHTHTKADITDFPVYGTTAGTICEGNDSRLSDARTPVAHTHTKSEVTDLLNSNFIPSANNSYDLGSSSYQWNKIYSADVVHTSRNETISDIKSFTGGIDRKSTSYEIGNTPASTASLAMNFRDKNNASIGWVRAAVLTSGATESELLVSNKFKNNVLDPTGTQAYQSIKVGIDNTGNVYHQLAGKLKQSELPFTTDTYDLGSSSYQWNNLYAKNYYYNGVAWGLDKANTWTGDNTFSNTLSIAGNTLFTRDRPQVTIGTIPSSSTFYGVTRFRDNNNNSFALERGTISSTWNYRKWFVYNFSDVSTYSAFELGIKHDGFEKYFLIDSDKLIPNTTGVSDLGTSDKKWKTLNGVNPGALSLPDMSATAVDISGSIVPPSGETTINISGGTNTYTATVDGWLCIVKASSACRYIKTTVNSRLGQTTIVSGSSISGSIYHCQPVPAGKTVSILLDADSQAGYYFYPCLGNV